jgi:hypothetical protein
MGAMRIGWVAMVLLLVSAGSAWSQLRERAKEPRAGFTVDHRCVDATDSGIPQAALDRARRLKVVLGHESVGFNVVQGIELLSQQLPQRYRIDVGHDVQAGWYGGNVGLGEFFVRNMANVPGKAQAFEQRLGGGVGGAVDVASLKLCWADLQQRSDADAAFKTYIDVMERMATRYPKVKFVFWTLPLRKEAMLNEKRERFNQLMRDYAKAHDVVLFDIADIESHQPDGTAVKDQNGREAMWGNYTNDGGHLNDDGKVRVARAWWWLTARLAGWSPS